MMDAHIKCSYQMTFEYVQVSKKELNVYTPGSLWDQKKGDGPNI